MAPYFRTGSRRQATGSYHTYPSANWQQYGYLPYQYHYADAMLAPDRYYDGRRRSRSTGGRPLPNINVVQNTYEYDDPPSRARSRSRQRYHDDDLVDAVDDVAREIRRGRSPDPYMMQLELARSRERDRLEDELWHEQREARQRAELDAKLARTRAELNALTNRVQHDEYEGRFGGGGRNTQERELERYKEEAKRRAEQDRLKEERDRIIAEIEREEQKAKDKQAAAVADYQKKQEKEKKTREEMLAQFKLEEEKKAQKAKEEKEMWRKKLEDEKREEEEKKKKKDKEIEEEMAKRLAKLGLAQNQVDAILDPKKKVRPGGVIVPGSALVVSRPTYIRIHRRHVEIDTLKYFNLPWEYDANDSEYYIIFSEMDTKGTEILFEHTRKLRKGGATLLIEDRGRHGHDHNYAFVRRRPSASPSRRKSSPKRVNVNFGLF